MIQILHLYSTAGQNFEMAHFKESINSWMDAEESQPFMIRMLLLICVY